MTTITRVFLSTAALLRFCACNLTMVHQWDEIDLSTSLVRDGDDHDDFAPENNVVYRMKIWNDTMYVAVPRFRRGVPATLCSKSLRRTVDDGAAAAAVRAYPSPGMQTVGNCFALQNVRDIEIDHLGNLWSLDAGRVYDLQEPAAPGGADRAASCDPKLFVVNVRHGGSTVVRSAVVPAGLYTVRSVLSGIALDLKTLTAIVADVGPDDPGFIVYNLHAGVFRKFRCRILRPAAASDGYDEAQLVVSPIDNILYFTTIRLDGLYSIPLSVLSDPRSIVEDVTHYANGQGPKADTSTAMAMDTAGNLYVAMTHKVLAWNTAKNRFDATAGGQQLYARDVALDWISDFAFDTAGYLWIVSSAFGDFLQATAHHGTTDGNPPKIPRTKVFKGYCDATSFALQQLAVDLAAANNRTTMAAVPIARNGSVRVATVARHWTVNVCSIAAALLHVTFARDRVAKI